MKNIGAVLEAAGLDFSHVVKTTCFLADLADFAAFNAVYGKYFPEAAPARSCFAVAGLPKGAKRASRPEKGRKARLLDSIVSPFPARSG